jgi:predicted nucleic acid-binding protein
MGNNAYVMDANVFIEASRRYYAFDLAPGFWNSLIHYANTGQIISIDRIKQELDRGKDNLAQWAGRDFRHAFATTNEDEVITSYGEIMNWVNSQGQFSDAAKAEFANDPDGWLVAYARVKGCIVVTHEVPSAEARRKVPIPNICQAFSVQFVDTFEMLRRLRVKVM